jgi:predicted metal-dependent hydrolase
MPDYNLFEKGEIFFNAGRYFEAHEAWEDLWRITDGPLRTFYQGLIQAAVGLYHLERGNLVGARGQLQKSIRHLSDSSGNPHSIDTTGLIEQLRESHDVGGKQTVRIARLK